MSDSGSWNVSFTITVNGIQIDFTELSEKSRMQILRQLINGEMKGLLSEQEVFCSERAVS